jgi:protein-disulfide isomerase
VSASGDTIPPATVQVGHTLGNPDAPIAVVEFSDFGCPYCARFARTTLPEIRKEFIDTGLVRWRYVPVTFGFAGGELMGVAAECAAREGGAEAFWEAHDVFYERQVALRGADARPRILDFLAEAGLDREALNACMSETGPRALLERHNQASQEFFVRGTPTFIVNGVPMSGALPLDFFRQVFATMLDPSGL